MTNISVETHIAVCSGRKHLDSFKALSGLSLVNKKGFQKICCLYFCASTKVFSNSCQSNFSEKELNKTPSLKQSHWSTIECIHNTPPHSLVHTLRCFSSEDKLFITSYCVKWMKCQFKIEHVKTLELHVNAIYRV